MENIYNYNYTNLENWLINIEEKKYRTKQIFEWLYTKRVNSFDMMKNMPNSLVAKLKENFSINTLKIVKKEEDIDVYKYLLELPSKDYIEAVLMRHNYGYSICLSTQVGCNMGCGFCESGKLKKINNLTLNQMIEPMLLIENDLNIKISRVVLMGIGEPFDNYDNVMKFVHHINDYRVLNIGTRHITISTCGLVPKIKKFQEENGQVNLAISLHAANNETRNKLMPINKAYNIELLITTLKEYINATNRRVTFEYILLADINDKTEDAIELANLLRGMNCYVNLIPYNTTSSIEYKRSTKENIDNFYQTLIKKGINTTLRREFGSKISGACGQLSSKGGMK